MTRSPMPMRFDSETEMKPKKEVNLLVTLTPIIMSHCTSRSRVLKTRGSSGVLSGVRCGKPPACLAPRLGLRCGTCFPPSLAH